MRLADWPGMDLDSALGKEWLETNGIGGFASSTIVGLNTRRYHGLLVAATHPPVGRMVLLSKLEETLIVAGERFELSANQYPGLVHPQGNLYLEEFRLDPFPVFVYQAGGVTIEKRIFLVQGENAVVVEYEVLTPSACQLEIRPLIAFRDYHSLTHRNDSLNAQFETAPQCVTVAPYSGVPALHFAHNAASVDATGNWYFDFCYRLEEERGLDAREDLFNPFILKFDLTNTRSAAVIASTGQRSIFQVAELREREIARRISIRNAAPVADAFVRDLTAAADQFIVKRGDLQTVIAGYHWFSDWGRDTMIALPGLTLATGRFEIAKNILRTFAGAVDRGMLPNRWPDAGETPEYNTADATLWFFEAAGALARYSGDYSFVFEHLRDVLNSIIDWHLRGTRFCIHVNDRGLLECGEPGSHLTWMDVKIGDYAVTPRKGMPVEIEALWYNALCTMEDFAVRRNDAAASQKFGAMAARAKESFDELFWNEGAGCLFDVVDGEIRDASIRPNQIFSVSLTHPILTGERAARVLERVERDLLTPRGLRSLSKDDPQYRPHYQGPPWDRDNAYHQGTVWSWLLGPFVTSYLRVHDHSAPAREKAEAWLRGFEEHLREAGLGQISEIFDGDAPHTPRGCIAQAWSVGEILRALVEDVLGQRPGVQNVAHSSQNELASI
ncbi:MAG TPA: amylo-alpha-1,6-glucosidase [Bryobacteraceae bacterium]